MSCSKFIEHEEDKSDTLVIIVKGDGTATVDPVTLERVIKTNQRNTSVSVIRFENSNEPDSQTDQREAEKDEKSAPDKDKYCRKVNLIVEGYYPPAANSEKTAPNIESVVSSTVGTPPLPLTTEYLGLLPERLGSPATQPSSQSLHPPDGCIRDSLVDAFSEMAPEQLKQVETALHSEKAKQILGDHVTSVLDTLKLNEHDDWVHMDHCYTNIYGSKKTNQVERVQNVVMQDSPVATMLTIKVGANETSVADTSTDSKSSNEPLEVSLPENVQVVNMSPIERVNENLRLSKARTLQHRGKTVPNENEVPVAKGSILNIKDVSSTSKENPVPAINAEKPKRKSALKNELVRQRSQQQAQALAERIVKDDEVDGVKVFKPSRNDKKIIKPFVLQKSNSGSLASNKTTLVQSKLTFTKKPESLSPIKAEPTETAAEVSTRSKLDSAKETEKNVKPAPATSRKPQTPVTPESFGPELFSNPDIIKKTKEEPSPIKPAEPEKKFIDDQTADIEKRMSAIENGEAMLDQIHLQMEMQKKESENMTSVSDDDKLLSDLENSTDEDNHTESKVVTSTPMAQLRAEMSKNTAISDGTNSEFSRFNKSDASDKGDDFDGNDEEYEDDPSKLWCICKKPHNNRFMICCDACDNWFHGYCVNISRAKGKKMEQSGMEWHCPNCKAEKPTKEPDVKVKQGVRLTPGKGVRQSLPGSANNSMSTSSENLSLPDQEYVPTSVNRRRSSSSFEKAPAPQICIECQENEAMENAIYCSNTCIENYVINKNKEYAEPLPSDLRMIVRDELTEKIITGMRAPAMGELVEWLIRNPSFRPVKPSKLSALKYLPEGKVKTIVKPAPIVKSVPPKAKETKEVFKSRGQLIRSRVNEDGTIKVPGVDMQAGQVSMKQFLVKRTVSTDNNGDKKDVPKLKIKRNEDGSGSNVIVIGKDGQPRLMSNIKKDVDQRLKDKQRQMKLIPAQALPKMIDEKEQKVTTLVIKKPIPPIPGVATIDKKKRPEPPRKEKPIVKKPDIKKPDTKKSITEENTEQTPAAVPTPVVNSDAMRAIVRKGLTDTFMTRLKEATDINASEEEVRSLAVQIEEELFSMFKDTSKYKGKYRTLVFNMKDPKNTIFKRVVEKSVTPAVLVRLDHDELAPKELAQWREREAKHELDMIKKAELENLSQSKVLLKTHKGELEIDSESLPLSKAEVTVPDLQDEVPEEKKKSSKKSLGSHSKDKERTRSSRDKESREDRSDKKDRDRDKDRHKRIESRDKHKSSSSRKHQRRSSERDKHRSRSRRRSSEKERKRSKSREKTHRSRSSEKSYRSKSDEKERLRSSSKRTRSRSRSRKHSEKSLDRRVDTKTAKNDNAATAASTVDIPENEDTTMESTKVFDDGDSVPAELLNPFNSVDVDLSDMEPTSTVTIQTPPHAHSTESLPHLWKGKLSMPDVAEFQAGLKEVSGNCEGLEEELRNMNGMINCVGRIRLPMVWEYISKVKKIGSKEILVLRFEVFEPEGGINYLGLYTYLNSKNRMGVVGVCPDGIKDFYIMALAKNAPVPQVLLPLDGPGFEEKRDHMLLAIIVRSRRKRYYSSLISQPSTSIINRKVEPEQYVPAASYSTKPPASLETDSFTPPHSPTSVFVSTQVPTTLTVIKNDEDEPYSPKDEEPYSPNSASNPEDSEVGGDAKAEEEDCAQNNDDDNAGSYSPSEHFFNELPAELQNLLNRVKNPIEQSSTSSSGGGMKLEADPIVDAYKKSGEKSDDLDETTLESENASPDDLNDDNDDGDEPEDNELEAEKEKETENISDDAAAEITEDVKVCRDPRKKAAAVAAVTVATTSSVGGVISSVVTLDSFRPGSSQPPPPGMEDEFPSISSTDDTLTKGDSTGISVNAAAAGVMIPGLSEATYSTQIANAAYAYAPTQAMAHYGPMMAQHQMYMTAQMYPQAGVMPYASITHPAQMYAAPTIMHRDPSMIPLPGEVEKGEKRKVDDFERESSRERDKKDSSSKRRKSYYRSDSKSRSDSRSPPPGRHKGASSYDSHRRGYQREDVENSSGHSRYGHGRSYQSRNRSSSSGGYWKSGADYEYSNSSSSGHKKYSYGGSDKGSHSSSGRRGSRWERDSCSSTKPVEEEDWDAEIGLKEKSDHKKSDSKRS